MTAASLLQSRVKLPLYTQHGWPKGEKSDDDLSWQRTHLNNLQTGCTKSHVDLLQRIQGAASSNWLFLGEPCCCACDQSLLLGMPGLCTACLVNKLLASSDVSTTADLAHNCILDANLLSAAPLPQSLSNYTVHHQITDRVELVKNHWSRYSTPVKFPSLETS